MRGRGGVNTGEKKEATNKTTMRDDVVYRSLPLASPEPKRRRDDTTTPISPPWSSPWTLYSDTQEEVMNAIQIALNSAIQEEKWEYIAKFLVFDQHDYTEVHKLLKEAQKASSVKSHFCEETDSVELRLLNGSDPKILKVTKVHKNFLQIEAKVGIQVSNDCWFQALVYALVELATLKEEVFDHRTAKNSAVIKKQYSDDISKIVKENNDGVVEDGDWWVTGFIVNHSRANISNFGKIANLMSENEIIVSGVTGDDIYDLERSNDKTYIYFVRGDDAKRDHAVTHNDGNLIVDPSNIKSYRDLRYYMDRNFYNEVIAYELKKNNKSQKKGGSSSLP